MGLAYSSTNSRSAHLQPLPAILSSCVLTTPRTAAVTILPMKIEALATITRADDRLILTVKMKHLSNCYEIPPPALQPGIHVVVFIVGLMHQLRTSIHKDLIFAASSEVRARYARHPEDRPCPPFVMDDVDPSVFQVLWDWLYARNVAERYQSNLENDCFWYAVFKMAERLRIPAVMLTAWKRFQLCFSLRPSNSKSQGRIIPSHVLLNILFRSRNPEIVFRDWIVTHLLWHSTYNSLHTSGGIEILLDEYTELAVRYGRLHSKGKSLAYTNTVHTSPLANTNVSVVGSEYTPSRRERSQV